MTAVAAHRLLLLTALLVAAGSVGCMGAYVAHARFNPIASDHEDLVYAQRASKEVYASLAASGVTVAYVCFFFSVSAFRPASRFIYVSSDTVALGVLLWASAATGGVMVPFLRGFAECHTPLCKLAFSGSVLKWAEVALLLLALATVIIIKLMRYPSLPWSLSLDHLPTYRDDPEEMMSLRALYESKVLSAVSLASSGAPPGYGGTLGHTTPYFIHYAVPSESSVALPLPPQPTRVKDKRESRCLSRPLTYFNSWAEGVTPLKTVSPLTGLVPRPKETDSRGHGRLE